MTHNTKEEWIKRFWNLIDKGIISFDDEGMDAVVVFINDLITSQRHQERTATIKECLEKMPRKMYIPGTKDDYLETDWAEMNSHNKALSDVETSLNNLIGE